MNDTARQNYLNHNATVTGPGYQTHETLMETAAKEMMIRRYTAMMNSAIEHGASDETIEQMAAHITSLKYDTV